MTDVSTRKYELMAILSGDLTEADFEKAFSELRQTLKENAKDVIYEESWGRRDFAYRVKKQKRGYYVIFDFNATPQNISELRATIKLNPHVLRHLLIVLTDNYEPDSYKQEVILEEQPREEEREKPIEKQIIVEPAAESEEEKTKEEIKKPTTVAGKEEEERLKTVEKRLEKILENPDINIS